MASLATRLERYFELKTSIVWRTLILITLIHILGIYGMMFIPSAKFLSLAFAFIIGLIGNVAQSAGAHRLWTHKTYKAKLPMRVIVMLCYMFSGMYSIRTWTRDHRAHHKFTDTDADPHNAARGLFFSHCGWLMMQRHPDLVHKGKVIDVSDLLEDPVIRFHQKYFPLLSLVFHVIFPSAVVYYVIGDTWQVAVYIGFFLRFILTLNLTFCGTSLLHYWGTRPYNNKITASNNAFLSLLMVGEGWHNYHHTFPWDYRNEPGRRWQLSSDVIAWCARRGWAYDLKTASPELVQKVLDKRDLPRNYEVPETGLPEEMTS